jgi:hypothetical protein
MHSLKDIALPALSKTRQAIKDSITVTAHLKHQSHCADY